MNEDKRRLATECGREVVETSEWANIVFERLEGQGEGIGRVNGGGLGDGEDQRLKGLAAGVLVACKEVGEKWRSLMVGDLVGV